MATTPNRSWPTPDDTDLVRDGAAAIRALGDAIDGSVGQGFVYAGTRYYTSSGQFAKADPLETGDIGLRAIRVRLVGGGGGGAGIDGAGARGGGWGGDYAERFVTDMSLLSASITVTVGAGGVPGTSSADGGTGGTSDFEASGVARCRARGGNGGRLNGLRAGRSSPFADADVVFAGSTPGSGGDGTQLLPGGAGGASHLGGGGQPGEVGANRNGFDGELYGGGGAGANRASPGAANGGAGADGLIIVDCFV